MKRIAIFTGSRAEYGLQSPILRAIDAHPELEYQLIVSGSHLDKNFGNTLDEIMSDGFKVHAEIKVPMDGKSLIATAQAIGKTIIEVSEALNRLQPDMVVIYGDRFESLAAVISSTQMNIPTAHVEGGDLTEGGALDDSVRHAMTKLSHVHFTTNAQATNRVLGLGEEVWRVHTVGLPAIDSIEEGRYANPKEVITKLGLKLTRPIVLFTQHSITTQYNRATDQIDQSLNALAHLARDGYQIIITYPNNDAGGQQIIERLIDFARLQPKTVLLRQSLGQFLYHGVLALAKIKTTQIVCVGNSSSGIKETPAFGCPCVNIGTRQSGRLKGDNVIDVPYETEAIETAIRFCVENVKFRKSCSNAKNPYWMGRVGDKIANILASIEINEKLVQKKLTSTGKPEA